MNTLTLTHASIVAITWLLVIFAYTFGDVADEYNPDSVIDLGESALTE